MTARPDLGMLLADPARVADVAVDEVPALLVLLAAVQAALAARLVKGQARSATPAAGGEGQGTPAPVQRLTTPGNAYATNRCGWCTAALAGRRRGAVYCGSACRFAAWKARRTARAVPTSEAPR